MRHYKYVYTSFERCPFSVILPKIKVIAPYVNAEFLISFKGKHSRIKYIVSECSVSDMLGHKASAKLEGESNFHDKIKHTAAIEVSGFLSSQFTLIITILTAVGEVLDVTYIYDRGKPLLLKSVAVADMPETEKEFFSTTFNSVVEQVKLGFDSTSNKKNDNGVLPQNHSFDEYISALSSELFFLKQNGGKKYKVSDGRLLTSNSSEICYSFELETELYLSDDAPVSLLRGTETVKGTVVVCDGFQIIVSLERNIGHTVTSAQISVEPWKLLENLRDRVRLISQNDRIAWKLFHQGPSLASKTPGAINIKTGQDIAIKNALDNDITVIWGPPGTGKTYTMAQITGCFVSMGKSVLIVSHSNISVDNVVKQISNQFSKNHLAPILSRGKVLRYGYVRDEELNKNDNCVAFNFTLNSHPELKKQYSSFSEQSAKLKIELQYKPDIKKAETRKDIEKKLKSIRTILKTETQLLMSKAQVVATTVSKIYMDKLFDNRKYDVVMFDEVSMAYIPQILCAATFAKERFICVGDFRQLSPIVQNESAKEILQRDIFSFLNINRNGEPCDHKWLVMLNEQRRMHPHISKFSNKEIYGKLLKDHPSVTSRNRSIVSGPPVPESAISLIDLYGTFCAASKNLDNSRFNILSAIVSFAIALKAETSQNDSLFRDVKNEEKVGIITPYAAQTRLIRALIQDYRQKESTEISCATVHQFQGSERNVVIFDAVESYPFSKPGWLVSKNENESVLRLINVALTRAKHKFITLANTRFWTNRFNGTKNTYYLLLEHIKKNNTVVGIKDDILFEFIRSLDFGKSIKPFYTASEAWEDLLKDVNSAKKKIYISLPTDKLNTLYATAFISAIKKVSNSGVSVSGTAREVDFLNSDWKGFIFKSKDSYFPLIIIDDKITWYGFPLCELFFEDKNSKYLTPRSPIFRISGKYTNDMICSLCDSGFYIDEQGTRAKLTEKTAASVGMGFSQYISNTEVCKKCGEQMNIVRGRTGKFSLKCTSCNSYDFIPVHTLNKYLDEVNAKCSVCGKDLYAGVGQYGIYVKCNNGHFTKLTELL